MNSKEIANFRQLGDMMLPRLLDANFLRNIDDYGDYALLTYHLAEPVPIQSALDDMEDNMDLNVLYHVEVISAATRGEHCCAYCRCTRSTRSPARTRCSTRSTSMSTNPSK